MEGIRVKESDLAIIKTLFKKYFQQGDCLWIFGSRVDPQKKGGDLYSSEIILRFFSSNFTSVFGSVGIWFIVAKKEGILIEFHQI